jgi:asparagine synthase (glutamine-hydrolysing)
MCGICGSVGAPDTRARVRAMLAQLVHRGPDGEGLWHDDQVALGHRRLSIVDLSDAGRQPMLTADSALVTVVNGEIYNYPDLRAELELLGARFASNSDSEVVLHCYRAWGLDGMKRLSGMFAFALYDRPLRRLVIARDRLGIKPVYYLHDATRGTLAFASEIKALVVASGRRTWRVDAQGLGQFLTYQNMLGDRTLFAGIRLLEPGTCLVHEGGQIKLTKFHGTALAETPASLDFAAAVPAFRDRFASSVRRHLMSDVPIACYLSSGFDSTMVASAAARHLNAPPKAFTGTFADGNWYDEATGAALVAHRIGAELTRVRIGAPDFEARLDDVVYALDEPRMGIGAFSQYMVASTAAEHGKVILTGHGGDELFSGYPVFKLALLDQQFRARDSAIVGTARSIRGSELPHLAYFSGQGMRGGEAGHFLPVLFSHATQHSILLPPVAEAVQATRDDHVLATIRDTSTSAYERIMRIYLNVYLPGLLVVEDKISMAHSLEARTPFLDDAMVDFSLSLSQAVKLEGGQLKAIVKTAARDVLPAKLFSMPKRGFPTPLAHWLRGSLAAWMTQRISAPQSPLRRLFRGDFLDRVAPGYVSSWRKGIRPLDEVQTHRMWMLLCLESWMRQFEERHDIRLELA